MYVRFVPYQNIICVCVCVCARACVRACECGKFSAFCEEQFVETGRIEEVSLY